MAPLAIAKEKGFFQEEGLNVTLEPQANWKVLLDGVIGGQLDCAHMPAGQPIAATLGSGPKADLIAPPRLDPHGHAIPLSNQASTLIEPGPPPGQARAVQQPAPALPRQPGPR